MVEEASTEEEAAVAVATMITMVITTLTHSSSPTDNSRAWPHKRVALVHHLVTMRQIRMRHGAATTTIS